MTANGASRRHTFDTEAHAGNRGVPRKARPPLDVVAMPRHGVSTDCTRVGRVLARIGDKWTVLIVRQLAEGPRRFGELKREIGGVSQRMLTLTLRGLERDGLVTRTVTPTIPPRVDYALTFLGALLARADRGARQLGIRAHRRDRRGTARVRRARRQRVFLRLDNPRMTVTRRVSVILPDDRWCSERENAFKWAIVERIEALGLVAEIFHDPRGTASLCAPMAWSAANADFISRRCVGAALIGLPRWRFDTAQGAVSLSDRVQPL